MSSPVKTSETLDLVAQAQDEDYDYACDAAKISEPVPSKLAAEFPCNGVPRGKQESEDDPNANTEDSETVQEESEKPYKVLDDLSPQKPVSIGYLFDALKEGVLTKESSSDLDFMDASSGQVNDAAAARASSASDQDFQDAEDRLVVEDNSHELTVIKAESDKEWKPKVGKVYSRVLELQKSIPKKYNPGELASKLRLGANFYQHQTPAADSVPQNCPECGKKIAAGAMARHKRFCLAKVANGN